MCAEISLRIDKASFDIFVAIAWSIESALFFSFVAIFGEGIDDGVCVDY